MRPGSRAPDLGESKRRYTEVVGRISGVMGPTSSGWTESVDTWKLDLQWFKLQHFGLDVEHEEARRRHSEGETPPSEAQGSA